MGFIVQAHPTDLPGVVVITTRGFSDHRGSFSRWFCDAAFAEILGSRRIVQINHSRTHSVGAVRGMHFQRAPFEEMKLIRCIRGRVWDVALDLRASSPTFLRWHAEELSAENGNLLVVPEGCAHGFQVMESDSEMLYLHTAPYRTEAEGRVNPADPRHGIAWPHPIGDLSERDRNEPFLRGECKDLFL